MAEIYEHKKEFRLPNSHECYNISRYLFESFPCPLVACCWTDKRMEELAKLIGSQFQMSYPPSDYSYPSQADVIEDEYYKVIEDCAISMGMKYYEDLSDDAYAKIKEWCKEHKE